jgi:aminoglycoside phosphotransferase (APT) family kinase protein
MRPVVARMHEEQVETSSDLVRRLLAAQFPHLSGLPVRPVAEQGTDHALYRLGNGLVVRLPIIDWAVEQAERDHRWLPVLAPHLPLAVPVPVVVGTPGEGYPWPWSVVPWLPGRSADRDHLDPQQAATDLARFIRALHGVDPTSGPVKSGRQRGAPLDNLDADVRGQLKELGDEIDTAAVTRVWDAAVTAPVWDGPPVWMHGDISPGNLIVRAGRLAAVIDFSGLGIGDPAPDLIPAWNFFHDRSRAVFREHVGYDDATWARAKGWVLAPALTGVRYYLGSRPDLVAFARRQINAVLSDR